METDHCKSKLPKQAALNRYIYSVRIFKAIIPVFYLTFLLCSCKEEVQIVPEIRETPGDIQVLNSSGIPGAAVKMRDYLRSQGFDVIEMSNDNLWNYEETIIAIRNPHWAGAEALAKALHTTNVIPLKNKQKLVDATVFVGKDFEKITPTGTP